MKEIIILTILNAIVLVVNIVFTKRRLPKWEYYKKGIVFYNEDKEVTIKSDKPLL